MQDIWKYYMVDQQKQIDQMTDAELLEFEKEIHLRESLPHLFSRKLYKWQKDFIESRNRYNFVTAANQIGKVQPNDTDIPTPNGFIKLKDIKIGDFVYGSDGNLTKVLKIFEHKDWQFYNIKFDDLSETHCGLEHLWICKTSKERFRKKYKSHGPHGRVFDNPDYNKWVVRSTEEIIKSGKYNPCPKSNYTKVSIPICNSIQYEDNNIFDPYLIGIILGDGGITTDSITITNIDNEIIEHIKKYNYKKTGKYGYRINGIGKKIHSILGYSGSLEKFIPKEYLQTSIENRKKLLAGLMDTDGTIDRKHNISYCTISEQLKNDFIQLVNSLGGVVNSIYKKKTFYKKNSVKIICNDAYIINFKILFNPFNVKRKKDRFKLVSKYKHERIIEKIEKSFVSDGRCIMVDNSDSSYLCTKSYIVTHNSFAQIAKCIIWATETDLWPKLWDSRPTQFWYFYPSLKLATIEFKEKWEKELLPRNEMKDDPKYGWTVEIRNDTVQYINFKSGVTLYFFAYNQKLPDTQAGTVYSIFTDEELPEENMGEVQARIRATKGYFHMVFTATLGQDIWKKVMEPETPEEEIFRSAFKRQISLYDCMKHYDGTPTKWTHARINEEISLCINKEDIDRRILGKFVKSSEFEKQFPSFRVEKTAIDKFVVPKDWTRYSAVDYGSGGEKGHPAAIVFIAVRPDRQMGIVYKCWRGDKIQTSTPDILKKYIEMRGTDMIACQFYDYENKDFAVLAQDAGEYFMKADKTHERGFSLVDDLLKHGMLKVVANDEGNKLLSEFNKLLKDGDKRRKKDDLADATRYCCTGIPWDMSWVKEKQLANDMRPIINARELLIENRNKGKKDELVEAIDVISNELEEANEYYDY